MRLAFAPHNPLARLHNPLAGGAPPPWNLAHTLFNNELIDILFFCSGVSVNQSKTNRHTRDAARQSPGACSGSNRMASRAHALSCKPSCSASRMPSPSPSTPLSLTPAAPSLVQHLSCVGFQRRDGCRCARIAATRAVGLRLLLGRPELRARLTPARWSPQNRRPRPAAVTSAEHSQEPGEPGHGGHGGELWRCREAAISTLPRVSASETLQVQPRPHSHSAHMHSSLAQTPRLMAPLKASFFSGGPPETTGSADADADACCSQSCAAW